MVSRIYVGHYKRYESWCAIFGKNPSQKDSLREYENHLKNVKKLSERYVQGVISILFRRWFPKTTGEKTNECETERPTTTTSIVNETVKDSLATRRANAKLSLEDFKKILEYCLENYEKEELALLILLVTLRPDLRPKHVLSKMNDSGSRVSFHFVNVPEDSKVHGVINFVHAGLQNDPAPIFTKKHNTYLIQLKKLTANLLGKEKGKRINFETLRRTNNHFRLYIDNPHE